MFFNTGFAGTSTSISNSILPETAITTITLKNMIADELYATKKMLVRFDWKIPKDWDFDTYLHALFQGDVYAGNVTYSESIVQKIKIKKRFKGEFTWKTIYEKEIHANEDFAIEFYDYYEPSNRDIEYAYVAVIANADTDTISTEVHSKFDSYFICNRSESYPMILDMDNTVTYNRESSTIVSPGRKYPYVVNNGIARYYSGTMNVTFIELKNCEFDTDNGWDYRNKLDMFLSDGQPKILKSFEGDVWMVNIIGSLQRSVNGHYQNVSHQIEWVECGDPTLISDLYDNNFIDVDTDRE